MVTVVNISADSLLDYMLHSRVHLLERLLGAEIYAILFEKEERKDQVASYTCKQTEPQVQRQLSVSTVNITQHFRAPKYRSQLLLSAYWRNKIRSSSYARRLEPLRGAPPSSSVGELAIDTRTDTFDTHANDRKRWKYKRPTGTKSADAGRRRSSADLSLTSFQLPLVGKAIGDSTIDSHGYHAHSYYAPTTAPFQGKSKKRLVTKSLPCLPSAQRRPRKPTEKWESSTSDYYKEETVSPRDCKQNRMSAGDNRGNVHFTNPSATDIYYERSDNNRKNAKKNAHKKKFNRRRCILLSNSDIKSRSEARTCQINSKIHLRSGDVYVADGQINLDKPSGQASSDMLGNQASSDMLGSQASSDMPGGQDRSDTPGGQTRSDMPGGQTRSDMPGGQKDSDWSSGPSNSEMPHGQVSLDLAWDQANSDSFIQRKRPNMFTPVPSIKTNSIHSGDGDSSGGKLHHSKGDSMKSAEIEDTSSYQLGGDLSVQSSSQSKAGKICSDISLTSSQGKCKNLQQSGKHSGRLKSTHNGSRNFSDIVAPLKKANRNRLPALSQASAANLTRRHIGMQSQQHSGLAVDQNGKHAMASKDMIGIPSVQSGQPSLHMITSTRAGKSLIYDDVKSTSPSTAAMKKVLDPKSLPTISDKQVQREPMKLQRGLNAKELDHCDTCGLGLWKVQPSAPTFFNLNLIMLTFAETNKNHYTTISKTVDSLCTVYGLIQFIKQEQDIASNTIHIYKDKSRMPGSMLPVASTLEDCGYEGSSGWYQATDLTLYYDYDSDYYDCPILISDFYFINRKRHVAANHN